LKDSRQQFIVIDSDRPTWIGFLHSKCRYQLENGKSLKSPISRVGYVLTPCALLILIKEGTISYLQHNKSPPPNLSYSSTLSKLARTIALSCNNHTIFFWRNLHSFIQAPEEFNASILAGAAAPDRLVAGVAATSNNDDPSASPNRSWIVGEVAT
jgi:hypothetical protein